MIFDVVRFVLPFVLSAKVLLQELWRLEVFRDKLFIKRHQEYCKGWTKALTKFSLLEFIICYHALGYKVNEIQLHVFKDASEVAYGAVAYLRFIFKI